MLFLKILDNSSELSSKYIYPLYYLIIERLLTLIEKLDILLESFLTNLEIETKKIAHTSLKDINQTFIQGFISERVRTVFDLYIFQLEQFRLKINRDRKIVLLPHLFELVIGTLTREFFSNYPDRKFSVQMEMHEKVTKDKRVTIPDITILEDNHKIAIIELKWDLKLKGYKNEIARRKKFSNLQYFTLLYWNQSGTMIDEMIADKCDWIYSVHPFDKIPRKKKGKDTVQLEYIKNYLEVSDPIEQIYNKIISHKL